MCIIVSKPKGFVLDSEIYEECYNSNDDGAGLAYVNDEGVLTVEKGFFKVEPLVARVQALGDRDMIIHCRVSTHGIINDENCHPFLVKCEGKLANFSFALAHNGQLPWRSTKEQSDTVCFINDLLGPHLKSDPWFLDRDSGRLMLRTLIGEKNKFVIMRYDADAPVGKNIKTYIINQNAGLYDLGAWFSNGSYLPWKGAKTGLSDIRRHPMFIDKWRKSGRQKEDLLAMGLIQDPLNANVWLSPISERYLNIINKKEEVMAPVVPFVPNQTLPHQKTGGTIPLGPITSGGSTTPTASELENSKKIMDATILAHLNAAEKKQLRQLGNMFFEVHFAGCPIPGVKNGERICYMRDEVRSIKKECTMMSDQEIDQFILLHDMKGDDAELSSLFEMEDVPIES